MTACYDKLGVHFYYPANWTVTDEETSEWPKTVSVQSSGGGFWSLMIYPSTRDPKELTDEVVETMRKEYQDLEVSPFVEQFDEVETAGYDMYFCCLDLIVNSRALGVRSGGRTLLLMWQAEDREYERLEPVFRAVTTSLLSPRPIG